MNTNTVLNVDKMVHVKGVYEKFRKYVTRHLQDFTSTKRRYFVSEANAISLPSNFLQRVLIA